MLPKSWISRASWWLRSKTTINSIHLLNFVYRNSWRLLKHESKRPGYTSAQAYNPPSTLYQPSQMNSLLTAALWLLCPYRLNVIPLVSWFKHTSGNSVWVFKQTQQVWPFLTIAYLIRMSVGQTLCLVATIYFGKITLEENCSCIGLFKNTRRVQWFLFHRLFTSEILVGYLAKKYLKTINFT